MPLVVACPSCTSKLKAPDHLIGKKVKCPKCSTTFLVQAEEEEAPIMAELQDEPAPEPARKPRPAAEEGEYEGRAEDEYDEDRPRRKQRRRDDDDYEGDYERRRGLGLEGLSNNYSISLGEWFHYAGAHYTSVLGPMIGFGIIYLLISATGAIPFVGPLISFLVVYPLAAGFTIVSLAQLKGKKWSFGDFFSGFRWWVPLICNALLLALIMIGCIIPGGILCGIVVAVSIAAKVPPLMVVGFFFLLCSYLFGIFVMVRAATFSLPMIIDRDCGPLEAIKGSWAVTRGHFWGVFGVLIVMALINLGGLLLCGIGFIFTLPYVTLTMNTGYLLIAGTQGPVEVRKN
jgi:hypothetical protein